MIGAATWDSLMTPSGLADLAQLTNPLSPRGDSEWKRSYLLAMGGLLVLTGIAFLAGWITNMSFWLLETFPALGTLG